LGDLWDVDPKTVPIRADGAGDSPYISAGKVWPRIRTIRDARSATTNGWGGRRRL
jgi:hypothetical protein